MGDARRRSIHLKDGVEASQRVRSSGRRAPSSTLAFNEQSGNCAGPEVFFGEVWNIVPLAGRKANVSGYSRCGQNFREAVNDQFSNLTRKQRALTSPGLTRDNPVYHVVDNTARGL